jgi:hypothetical protein
VAGQWFSPGTPVSSANKTDRHDITEILLKVALSTLTLIKTLNLPKITGHKVIKAEVTSKARYGKYHRSKFN